MISTIILVCSTALSWSQCTYENSQLDTMREQFHIVMGGPSVEIVAGCGLQLQMILAQLGIIETIDREKEFIKMECLAKDSN